VLKETPNCRRPRKHYTPVPAPLLCLERHPPSRIALSRTQPDLRLPGSVACAPTPICRTAPGITDSTCGSVKPMTLTHGRVHSGSVQRRAVCATLRARPEHDQISQTFNRLEKSPKICFGKTRLSNFLYFVTQVQPSLASELPTVAEERLIFSVSQVP
jgi:hypothetical protein